MAGAVKNTTDHDTIRRWVEERDGRPARVKGTSAREGDPEILRIAFQAEEDPSLEPVSWDEFFEKFDENDLAFLYQETTNGEPSRF